jgi:endonuclease-3
MTKIKTLKKMALQAKETHEIFYRFSENRPDPRIELEFSSPFTLLVAVVLSAQATDKGVNKATPALFAVADTPYKLLELGEERLKELIKTIGLYNTKAKNIIALSKKLVEDFGGEVPNNLEDLMKLPGVGRKSANVMLNSIWGHPTIAVDTHVFRVSNRIGFCTTKTPEATELALLEAVPEEWRPRAHHWLVLHGRYVCKARKPDCSKCIIRDICKFEGKTTN